MRFKKTEFNDYYFQNTITSYFGKSIEDIDTIQLSFLLSYSNKTPTEFKKIFYDLKEKDLSNISRLFGINKTSSN